MGQSSSGGIPIVSGAIAGLVAFVVTYVVTYILKSGEVSGSLGDGGMNGAGPDTWQGVGWYFFQAHNVGMDISAPGGVGGTNVLGDPEIYMLLLPVVVLLVGGFLVATLAGGRELVDGAIAGATMASSYVVLAALLAFLSEWSMSALGMSVSVGPNLIMAIIVAGIAYPVVLGGIGGLVGGALKQ